MHTTAYDKHPKSCACWYVYILANITVWCPSVDAAHATAGSTN